MLGFQRTATSGGAGAGSDVVSMRLAAVKKGDTFLLCSDGLHDMLTDREIQELLRMNSDIPSCCDQLVERALEKGGIDNVTVIVAKMG